MINATAIQTEPQVYYVSLPFYGHNVLKCQGLCPDDQHKAFYLPYFAEHGPSVISDKQHGPFKVEIMPYIANRIILRDGKWVAHEGM